MIEITREEVKHEIERLLDRVSAGEEVVIEEAGHPVARIVPYAPKKRGMLGAMRGQIQVSEEFDNPLPAELLETFER